MTTTQCRSIYMIDTGVYAHYYRCLLDRDHKSDHFGVAIDQYGALIPEQSEEVTWKKGSSLNDSFELSGPSPVLPISSTYPQDPAQMKLDMETP